MIKRTLSLPEAVTMKVIKEILSFFSFSKAKDAPAGSAYAWRPMKFFQMEYWRMGYKLQKLGTWKAYTVYEPRKEDGPSMGLIILEDGSKGRFADNMERLQIKSALKPDKDPSS